MDTNQFIKKAITEIKKEVGKKKTLCAISGGVDSTTCAVLAHRALGKNLISVFLDDGLMRGKDEREVLVVGKKMGIPIKVERTAARFFAALKGKVDPEEKRIAFRETFYQVLGETVKKEGCQFLVQGTIAADIVETKGKIKTQHNVLSQIGIDPKRYGFIVIEPLKSLYKPQVRQVAKALGLPKEVFTRMAFPGPGLMTRIIGDVTPERVRTLELANRIVEEEITQKQFEKMYQAFAVLLSDKATGIRNGKRIFGEIIAIRSVDSQDALTATPTKVPWEVLQRITQRITREIPGIVKVLYDLTGKPPSTIEYI